MSKKAKKKKVAPKKRPAKKSGSTIPKSKKAQAAGKAGSKAKTTKTVAKKPSRGKWARLVSPFRLRVLKVFRLDENGKRLVDEKGGFQTLNLAETRSEELYAYSEVTDEFSYVSDSATVEYGTYIECGIQTSNGNEVASVEIYSTGDPVTPVLTYDDPSTPADPTDPTVTCDPTTTGGDYEEYGDPDEEPTYEYSDCDGTIGIRA